MAKVVGIETGFSMMVGIAAMMPEEIEVTSTSSMNRKVK